MKWITAILILNLARPCFAKIETILGDLPIQKNLNFLGTLPITNEPEIIISRKQYLISYNKITRGPNFALWELDENKIGKSGRTKSFSKDPDLENYFHQTDRSQHAVEPVEYDNSCLDRGHVVPSADRSDRIENNAETFLMSNMLPQTPYLNRVLWEHLEKYTRELVLNQHKKVYIIAGPIYDENYGAIGPHQDIRVPSKEFKIIFVTDANKAGPSHITHETPAVAVIMPNVEMDGKKPEPGSKTCAPFFIQHEDMNDWTQYKTTVDEVERLSGLQILSTP
jgi:endonuclease G